MSGLSEQEREQAPMTLADVGELVGDDISFWLNNALMTPDMIAGKVLWWISRAQAAAREEAAAKVEALAAAYVRAGDRETRRRSYAQGVAWRGAAQGLRDLAADIRKGDDRG